MPFNVFYLDDEVDLCEVFLEIFSSDEIKITTFAQSVKMIEASKINPPDLIFIDYRLPILNGDEVALALNLKVPIYLITGDIAISTQYKFEKILSKPYTNEIIISIINQHKNKANAA